MARSETLETLNRRWKKCCKVIFREEIGDVWEYDGWLSGMIDENRREKSCVSGKEVVLGIKEYAKGAKFISFDEIDFGKKYAPAKAGGAAGIGALVEALSDRLLYAGNLVIGNCGNVERSANISDSFFVYDSAQYGDSKYLYKCTVGRLSEDMFGVHGPGESQMCIRCTQTYRERRCLECWMCQNVSDCYYSFNLQGCTDCIFCFNLKNRRHCVGNAQLSPQEYEEAKARLLSGMASRLRGERKLPSLMEIVAKTKYEKPEIPPQEEDDVSGGKGAVEAAFTRTAKLVLGAPLSGIDNYLEWLEGHTHRMEEIRSAANGRRILVLPYAIAIPAIDKKRVITAEEAAWLGENSALPPGELEGLALENAHERIGRIAFHNFEFREGKNSNLTDCTITIECSHCYHSSAQVYSKYCACGMWPRSSEHCFGFDTLWDCGFCIKCFHSVRLTRCFECDACRSSSDCYYCHDVENCHDCLFCFNVKNLRHAVGNVEVGREEYAKVKKLVLAEIGAKLAKDRELPWSIYDIGTKR